MDEVYNMILKSGEKLNITHHATRRIRERFYKYTLQQIKIDIITAIILSKIELNHKENRYIITGLICVYIMSKNFDIITVTPNIGTHKVLGEGTIKLNKYQYKYIKRRLCLRF